MLHIYIACLPLYKYKDIFIPITCTFLIATVKCLIILVATITGLSISAVMYTILAICYYMLLYV